MLARLINVYRSLFQHILCFKFAIAATCIYKIDKAVHHYNTVCDPFKLIKVASA